VNRKVLILLASVRLLFHLFSSKGKAAHFKSRFQKKQVVLGLLAVLGNVPDAALPAQLGSGLPQLMSGLVRVLLDLKEQQDEAAAREASEEDDEGPVSDVVCDTKGGAGDGGDKLRVLLHVVCMLREVGLSGC
jgi:hypothetical protein